MASLRTAEDAIKKGFTSKQLDALTDYLEGRLLSSKHSNMAFTCQDIGDDIGEDHHVNEESFYESKAKRAEKILKRAKIQVKRAKGRNASQRWWITKPDAKRLLVSEDDLEFGW